MGDFIRVDVTSSATDLADAAVERLQDQWPGYEPNDGDLEVVLIEAIAAMAQNAAEVAAIVPASIFRKLGTDIYGIAYQAGAPATGLTTWVLEDTDGHKIPAGAQIDIDGVAFATTTDATVAAGSDTVTGVEVAATEDGTAGNDLAGTTVVPLSALDWVADVTLQAPTSNGADPEDDLDYQDRLSQQLQLQARTVITLRDHELFALGYTGIGRATAYKPSGGSARDVVIVLTDTAGDPVGSTLKTTILADLNDLNTRRVNTTITLGDADYTDVDVTWAAVATPGYTPADLVSRVNATLSDFLSPINWGTQQGTDGRWINETVVRLNKVIGLIEGISGIDYVTTLTINGTAADLTLTGTVALPSPGTLTGTIA